MYSPRFIALLLLGALAVAAVVVFAVAGQPASPPLPADGPGAAAPRESVSPAAPASGSPAGGDTPSGPATLAAVQTIKRLCDHVDRGDLRAARRLLASPRVWPRRELAAIVRLRLVSAQVERITADGDLVLLVRLRARLRAPSPLHDGVNTLFFTLRRDGTTGGWLVTAVTSSP